MTTNLRHVQSRRESVDIFKRVVVGTDGSPAALEAARQAAALADGWAFVVAVHQTAPTIVGGTGIGVPVHYDDGFQRELAGAALAKASSRVEWAAPPQTELTTGNAWDALLAAAKAHEATLIAVGAHGFGRIGGILLGSVATELLHKARCSVLAARAAGERFPERIVVGVDGSAESAVAYDAASVLARRCDAELWPVVAHGGEPVDKRRVAEIVGDRREDLPDKPVDALVAAVADADLVVVGSRRLHGVRALGSVSERVAHRAACSTLVVRRPA